MGADISACHSYCCELYKRDLCRSQCAVGSSPRLESLSILMCHGKLWRNVRRAQHCGCQTMLWTAAWAVTRSSGLAGESITAGNDVALFVESFLDHAVKGICKGAFLATLSCCASWDALPTTFPLQSVLTQAVYRQATRNSHRKWQYHMLHVYNCILLKMSTWGFKHVEENIILFYE